MSLKNRLERLPGIRRRIESHSVTLSSAGRSCSSLSHLPGGAWKRKLSGLAFRVTKAVSSRKRHGSMKLDEVFEVESHCLDLLSGGGDSSVFCPQELLFLDTETTGLAGGAGTYVFLVGIGYFQGESFKVDQFLLTDLGNEKAFLEELAEMVQFGMNGRSFRKLVSFNGKSYDLNLLESRYLINSIQDPFRGLSHLDLLYPARVLWKGILESCSLQNLERSILRFRRPPDIPSALIPRIYFNYLRSGDSHYFPMVLQHNFLDILSLVGLLTVCARALKGPNPDVYVDPLAASRLRYLRGDNLGAIQILEQALQDLHWEKDRVQVLLHLARLKKAEGERDQMLSIYLQVIDEVSQPPLEAFCEAAKVLEHHRRDLAEALALVRRGLDLHREDPDLTHRKQRLSCRVARKSWRKACSSSSALAS